MLNNTTKIQLWGILESKLLNLFNLKSSIKKEVALVG